MVYTGPLRRDYSFMNYEQARQRILEDLQAYGYTQDDLEWLLKHGWQPVSTFIDASATSSGRETR
jgi:hypothetical protein